jgi:hypothetical protein
VVEGLSRQLPAANISDLLRGLSALINLQWLAAGRQLALLCAECMAVDALLPPPGASPREVLFRRLLLQSSRLVAKQQQQHAQQLPQPEGLEAWRKDPKLHAVGFCRQQKPWLQLLAALTIGRLDTQPSLLHCSKSNC